jgi:hypothetical protein
MSKDGKIGESDFRKILPRFTQEGDGEEPGPDGPSCRKASKRGLMDPIARALHRW